MNNGDIHIHLGIPRGAHVWGAALLILCCGAMELGSEPMAVTSYYPSPVGSYQKMTVTHGVSFGGSGSLGIGTSDPAVAGQFKLGVQGGVYAGSGLNVGGSIFVGDTSNQGLIPVGNLSGACPPEGCGSGQIQPLAVGAFKVAGNITLNGDSVVTTITCDSSLNCSKSGNTCTLSSNCDANGECHGDAQ